MESYDPIKGNASPEGMQALVGSANCSEGGSFIALVGNWEWDFASGDVTWSDGVFRLLGLEPREMPANLDSFMRWVHPEDVMRVRARTDEAASCGESLDFEFRVIRADKMIRWIASKGEIFRDGAGKPAWAAGTLFDVTGIREAQRELEAREERYRALATLNTVGEWRATPGGEQIECRFWSAFTGQDQEQLRDHGWLSAVHPDDVEWIKGIYFDALELGTSAVWSFRVRHHSGHFRRCQSKMLPLKDEQSNIREWIGTIEDIHERREAEEQARTEGVRSRLALEAARMVTWDYDLQTRKVIRSDNSMQIIGIGSGDLSETENYIHPDDRQRVMYALGWTEDTGEPFDVAYRLKSQALRTRWVRARGKLLHDPQNGTRRIVGITFDITTQKEAEADHARARDQLVIVAARLAALSTLAGELVWIASPEGMLEESCGWHEFTGQSPLEMKGWGWLKALHPADRERIREAVLTQPGAKRTEGDYRLRTRTGEYVWVHSRGVAVASSDGRIVEWIGVVERRSLGPVSCEDDVKRPGRCDDSRSTGELDRQVVGGAQIRAARGLVNWSVRELSDASGVSASTIRRIELEVGYPENRDHGKLCMLRSALEGAGVVFLCSADGRGGVKLAPV
jgi:PAS domain S-box-containing protein